MAIALESTGERNKPMFRIVEGKVVALYFPPRIDFGRSFYRRLHGFERALFIGNDQLELRAVNGHAVYRYAGDEKVHDSEHSLPRFSRFEVVEYGLPAYEAPKPAPRPMTAQEAAQERQIRTALRRRLIERNFVPSPTGRRKPPKGRSE